MSRESHFVNCTYDSSSTFNADESMAEMNLSGGYWVPRSVWLQYPKLSWHHQMVYTGSFVPIQILYSAMTIVNLCNFSLIRSWNDSLASNDTHGRQRMVDQFLHFMSILLKVIHRFEPSRHFAFVRSPCLSDNTPTAFLLGIGTSTHLP